mgnify:FL=1
MIEPFANNHQSMQIGDLVIENQIDKVIIYGDIELQRNDVSLQQAKKLHEFTTKILQFYENQNIHINKDEESKSKDDRSDDNINNPFM